MSKFQILAPVSLDTGAHHTQLFTIKLITKGYWNPDAFFFYFSKEKLHTSHQK